MSTNSVTVSMRSCAIFLTPFCASTEPLPKITLPVISEIPILSTMFASLTTVDYLAFVMAIVMYIIMYKTVIGFRLRAIGINDKAASSLGINVKRYQIVATTLAGGMIGLVEEGDIISINIPAHTIELKVSDEVLAERKAKWVCPEPKIKTGYLARYAKMVSSADKGAILE